MAADIPIDLREREMVDQDITARQIQILTHIPDGRQMAATIRHDDKLRRFLLAVDQDIAARVRSAGCKYCGGVLHSALYPRVVLDAPETAGGDRARRIGFCCDKCRRRTTPASVRYMGRRRYSATAMILLSAVRNEIGDSTLAAMRASLGVTRRTLARWRRWWREDFVQTPLWQAQQGRFMPPVQLEALPLSLLDRFNGDDARIQLIHLLRFLLPLSGPGMFTTSEAR
jgi:hypothetical protein